MTDYLYSLSLARQTQVFLMSLGFGFLMGLVYDGVRIVRVSISRGRSAFLIFDLLYCIFLCFASFLFFLAVNEGEIRFYILLGEAAGFAIYYFSLGALIFSVSEKIIDAVKSAVRFVIKIICAPFLWILRKLRRVFNKLVKKSRKNGENIKNKSNFLLKVNKHLLYNLFNSKKSRAHGEVSDGKEA